MIIERISIVNTLSDLTKGDMIRRIAPRKPIQIHLVKLMRGLESDEKTKISKSHLEEVALFMVKILSNRQLIFLLNVYTYCSLLQMKLAIRVFLILYPQMKQQLLPQSPDYLHPF